jgi:hypothetical protein
VSGTPVPVACTPATAPTPTGGTITSGTYVLISSTFFGKFCPEPQEFDLGIFRICGDEWQTAFQWSFTGMGPTLFLWNATVPTTSGAFNGMTTCGSTQLQITGYTATPTTLSLSISGGYVSSFALQAP